MNVLIASPIGYKLDVDGTVLFTGADWLTSILAQDYPELSVYALANDLKGDMLDSLRQANVDDRAVIDEIELNPLPDQRGRRRKTDGLYARFAELRNRVLDHVLTTDADYYVSIDSDIMVHPDCVSQLVEQMECNRDYGIIAGIVNNTRRVGCELEYPKAVYNFRLLARKVRVRPGRLDTKQEPQYERSGRFLKGSFIDAGYTGACMIIRADMLRKNPSIRWGPHRKGEDLFFCELVRAAGYKIGVDTSITTLHKMDSTTWRGDVEAFDRHEII